MTLLKKESHTPGPWRLAELNKRGMYANDGSCTILKDDGEDIAGVALVVCRSPIKRGKGYKTKCTERDANARLIAAAPDLLAFARSIVEAESEGHMMPKWMARDAREVIAKATGEAL